MLYITSLGLSYRITSSLYFFTTFLQFPLLQPTGVGKDTSDLFSDDYFRSHISYRICPSLSGLLPLAEYPQSPSNLLRMLAEGFDEEE